MLSKQVGRKAMVVLTDGVDEGSRLKLRDAIQSAQKADVVCYVLLLSDPQYGSDFRDMHELTEQTGGLTIEENRVEKIARALDQVSRELVSQLYISYSPDNPKKDGAFRKNELESNTS